MRGFLILLALLFVLGSCELGARLADAASRGALPVLHLGGAR